ncbi:MAG: anti-sigma factor antagonist [Calditrichaeota bacterium]|nr:MAG: anti-sigma factor antagonist [Calditrichota bacterium]
MEGIEIQEYKVGVLQDIALLKTFGYIDTNTSAELQKVINQTIENGYYQMIIDMASVQYVSSAGWGVFVGEIRRLKEKGGDLKITQMSPEVNEVFEMLEFHQILAAYDRLEEAIEDYDFCRDLHSMSFPFRSTEIVEQPSRQQAIKMGEESPVTTQVLSSLPTAQDSNYYSFTRTKSVEVDEKKLPINEKIKKIVLENPLLGLWSIRKTLFSPRFGYTKLTLLQLYSLLKRLNLHSKAKRLRYYRSR